jgi:drug/metabolite transporter (DMT)-like permease
MPVIYGLLSALSFGIGDFLVRFSSKEVGFKRSLFWMLVVGGFFYLSIYSIFFGGFNPNLRGLIYCLIAGVLVMVGLFFLYNGLERGPVSIVAAIAATNPFFVFLIRFLLGSDPTKLQWYATLAIISGAILVSFSANSFKESLGMDVKKIRESVIIAFGASIFLELGLIFSQEATNYLNTTETVIYIRFFSLFSIAILLLFLRIKPSLTKKSIPILFFQGILETSGGFFLVSAYVFDPIGIAVVVSSAFGLITIILARFILKERIEKLQILGISITFIGIIGISTNEIAFNLFLSYLSNLLN